MFSKFLKAEEMFAEEEPAQMKAEEGQDGQVIWGCNATAGLSVAASWVFGMFMACFGCLSSTVSALGQTDRGNGQWAASAPAQRPRQKGEVCRCLLVNLVNVC